uniref:Uncharacterized protein n=1 Tax=Plectus sambesii TaxID=2011161 RepID=A0A914WV86_9BILA
MKDKILLHTIEERRGSYDIGIEQQVVVDSGERRAREAIKASRRARASSWRVCATVAGDATAGRLGTRGNKHDHFVESVLLHLVLHRKEVVGATLVHGRIALGRSRARLPPAHTRPWSAAGRIRQSVVVYSSSFCDLVAVVGLTVAGVLVPDAAETRRPGESGPARIADRRGACGC